MHIAVARMKFARGAGIGYALAVIVQSTLLHQVASFGKIPLMGYVGVMLFLLSAALPHFADLSPLTGKRYALLWVSIVSSIELLMFFLLK